MAKEIRWDETKNQLLLHEIEQGEWQALVHNYATGKIKLEL